MLLPRPGAKSLDSSKKYQPAANNACSGPFDKLRAGLGILRQFRAFFYIKAEFCSQASQRPPASSKASHQVAGLLGKQQWL